MKHVQHQPDGAPRGWRCTIGKYHTGPCPMVPAWWNFTAKWRIWRYIK